MCAFEIYSVFDTQYEFLEKLIEDIINIKAKTQYNEILLNKISESTKEQYKRYSLDIINSIYTVSDFERHKKLMKTPCIEILHLIQVPYADAISMLLKRNDISNEIRVLACNEQIENLLSYITAKHTFDATLKNFYDNIKVNFNNFFVTVSVLKHVLDSDNQYRYNLIETIMSDLLEYVSKATCILTLDTINSNLLEVLKDIKYRYYFNKISDAIVEKAILFDNSSIHFEVATENKQETHENTLHENTFQNTDYSMSPYNSSDFDFLN